MNVNLPFGGTIEVKDPQTSQYKIGKKWRFKITDKWGWDINKATCRDIKINNILNEENNENVLLHMYLTRPGKMEGAIVWINLKDGIMTINGDNINVKFHCQSLDRAEELIELILQPNELEVAPVNLIKPNQ